MKRWVILSALPAVAEHEDAIAERTRTAMDLVGVQHCSGGVDLPGSIGGCGTTWDLTSDLSPTSVLPDLRGPIDAVSLAPIAARPVDMAGRRIKRTLLISVRAGTSVQVVRDFERALMAMPAHIDAIGSWALSRVDGCLLSSTQAWTHVWEQEFAGLDDLHHDYLLHPYQLSHVDTWFDPEHPRSIVHPDMTHLYRWADRPVLEAAA